MNSFDNSDIVVCRPALVKDSEEVMELCSHIWEGGDYIPQVWEDWLADPDGLLGVAEYQGRVAGVFKLTKFQEEEWYMEGLRVYPDFQGMGIASHIHEYVVETWRKMGKGKLRLTTGSYNVKVHHLCEQTGFKRIAEFIPYRAPVILEEKDNFTDLHRDEATRALDFVSQSSTHAYSQGLINLGWVYTDTQLKYIQESINKGRAWWWRDGIGFISIWEDREDEMYAPSLELIACSSGDLPGLLLDYRRLMGRMGYQSAGWVAPNHIKVLPLLEKAGFQRSWDVSLYIYELMTVTG